MADFKKYGRTANLFDTSNAVIDKYVTANGDIADGVLPNYNFNYITIPVTPNSQYSFSFGYVVSTVDIGTYMGTHRRIIAYDSNGDFLSQIVDIQPNNNYTGGGTFTTPNNCYYISINYINTEKPNYDTNMMLNAGSTVLPYQPYLDWQHSLRKQCTATETITTLPVDIYADGTAATVSLKGNEQHTGTPSPSNPVEVNGVGVRTENLFDGSYTDGYIGGDTGTRYSTSSSAKTAIVKCEPNTTYTIKKITSSNRFTIATSASYPQDSEIVNVLFSSPTETTATITTPADASYLLIYVSTSSEQATPDMMLNAGSTAKPYEPYGYKIPISSGGVTTNIYLGSTPLDKNGTAVDTIEDNTLYKVTNRSVLTGSGNWTLQSINQYGIANFYLANVLTGLDVTKDIICSHGERQTTGISQTTTEGFIANNNGEIYFRINSTTASTVPEFKAWLSEQNPQVTFLYTLATPTSTTVTAPSIPTTEGTNTITVDTTVQPSEFTATWTGWHNASVKEKSENVMPFASAQTIVNNGVTFVSDGMGRYTVNGTATADASADFDIPEFTIPVSVGAGGQGTFSLFNDNFGDNDGNVFEFYNNTTLIDVWSLHLDNRTSTTYVAMGSKKCNRIRIVVNAGISIDHKSVKPMFTNNSTLPTAYEPYWK